MKAIQGAIVAAFMVAATPAFSQTLDLSTVKCRDFLASGKDNISIILAWMNAFYADEDAPPVIDFAKMAKDAELLGQRCSENPDHGLMTVANALFDK